MLYIQSNSRGEKSALGRPPQYLAKMWPLTNNYFSDLNPIYVENLNSQKELTSKEKWIARDGLVPLLWFFKQNPIPIKANFKLLIPIEFIRYAPKSWCDVLGTYRLTNALVSESKQIMERKNIILTGCVSGQFTSLTFLELQLKKIANYFLLNNTESVVLKIYLVYRHYMNSKEEYNCYPNKKEFEVYPIKYMDLIYKYLSPYADISIINHQFFNTYSLIKDHSIIDINEKLLIADNYILHNTLNRGGQLFDVSTQQEGEEYHALSPHHGFFIKNELCKHSLGHIEKLMFSNSQKFYEEFQDMTPMDPQLANSFVESQTEKSTWSSSFYRWGHSIFNELEGMDLNTK